MDTTRRFKKVKITLMRSPKFVGLSGIMMLGKTTLDDSVPTACTNGRDEIYNPEFVWQFGEKGVGFIIIHENLHKAARHMHVYKPLNKIDPQLANAACDYWINGKIKKADPNEELVAMPHLDGKQVGLYDAKYDGWTVNQIFKDLKQDQEENGGAASNTPNEGDGLDDHDWEGAQEMTEEQAKKLEGDIKQAIRQGQMAAKKAGAGAGSDVLGLTELIKSKVDWKQQLREFMQSSCVDKQESSWRRPNRRFLHQDIVMPTLIGESIKEIAFCRDASGSMYCEDRLKKVTSEMVGIVKALHIDKIHLIDWDGAVGFHGEFSSDDFQNSPDVKSVRGGGGTDPRCVAAYLKEKNIKPDAIVMLTDGEIYDWGNWDAPILWAIANRDKVTAPVGKTIHLGDDT